MTLPTPLLDRLVFAAWNRCACGAGYAFDPDVLVSGELSSPGPSRWECGDMLRYDELSQEQQAGVSTSPHSPPLPFETYEVRLENAPGAEGETTRPAAAPSWG